MQSYGLSSRLANIDNFVGDMGQDLEFAHDHVEDEFTDVDEEIQLDEIRELDRAEPSNNPEA